MKIRMLCVGKMASAQLRALAEDYRDRLAKLCDFELIEMKDESEKDAATRLAREGDRLLAAAGHPAECVLWDEKGEALDSPGLARFLEKKELASAKRLTFIMGSSHGLSNTLKALVSQKIQLGRFTYPHELARVMALEQLFRAHCIKKNIPYHH